jgi:hypothetical protein
MLQGADDAEAEADVKGGQTARQGGEDAMGESAADAGNHPDKTQVMFVLGSLCLFGLLSFKCCGILVTNHAG